MWKFVESVGKYFWGIVDRMLFVLFVLLGGFFFLGDVVILVSSCPGLPLGLSFPVWQVQ